MQLYQKEICNTHPFPLMKHCTHVCVAHLCLLILLSLALLLLIFHFSSVSRARGGVGWHKRRVSGRLGFWASSQNQSNHRQRDHKYKSYQSIQSLLYTNPRKSPSIAVRQCCEVGGDYKSIRPYSASSDYCSPTSLHPARTLFLIFCSSSPFK